MKTLQSKPKFVKSKVKSQKYKQHRTPENEQLRQFLTYYANMSTQKKIVVFFMKRITDEKKPDRESLIPVNITLGSDRSFGFTRNKTTGTRSSYRKGFVLYAEKITNNICENILQETSDHSRKIEAFFSVQELKKNIRKEDDVLNIVTFPYFDDIPASFINKDLISDNYLLKGFPFPIQFAAETSPDNYQLFWCLKKPQAVKNVNYWKQVLSVMKIVGNDLTGHVDTGGSNINQLYRLPNTYNYKQKYSKLPKTKLTKFDKTKALEFRNAWSWILNKYIQIKYEHFYNAHIETLNLILKDNDYLLLENITGDFEHHTGKKQTPSERSMSFINRLYQIHKLSEDEIYNLWKDSPNESKSKGHLTKNSRQYFNRMWQKLTPADKPAPLSKLKPARKITLSNRESGVLSFFEVPALLFGRRRDVNVQLTKERRVGRHSRRGLGTKTGTVLLWLISQAVKNNYEISIPTKEFFERWGYQDTTFAKFKRAVEYFLFTDSKYKTIREFKNSTLNIIGSLERSGGFIRFSLDEGFRKVLRQEKIRKIFDSKYFKALDYSKERYTVHLLTILHFILYDKKFNGTVALKELGKRLGLNIKSKSAEKLAAKRIRDSLDELLRIKLFNFSYDYDNLNKIFIFKKHKELDFKG